ncbi:hypothetical protein [Humisphaera borealis]|uniref:Uncharacterized protein n=1 Tax=Humisphaera borealis TaxID=2807512 RepID=A0A7M2WZL9_9BACT|nr:hypothetical protein [Humisphaera borealis]QOV90926.1 hypothetical protein IPV69_06075 [Humisphaera borealis]
MSRYGTSGGERIEVKPSSNVYTVLAAVGFVVVVLALLAMITKAKELMPPGIME